MLLPEIQAVILAGGQSRRMGQPKMLLDFRGNTFIAHLLSQLQQQVNDVMVAGVVSPDLLAGFPVPVLADAQVDSGPLAGIATALSQSRRDWLLTVPCDNPLLPKDYAVRLLHTARTQSAPLVYVRKRGRDQPLYALIRRHLLPDIEAYLASGQRKVLPWYQSVGAVAVDWDDAGFAFENLNTPVEYAAFLDATNSAV
jgi:molybdopterin-guanine dinucleotide biosynthesis protein A